jgi:FkbM family methyltransferase
MSSYTNQKFTQHIKTPLSTIVECGSRDCLDAIEMLNYYKPSKIYSFECNPESIQVCKKNIKNQKDIVLMEYAVSNHDGSIDFYATDMEKSTDKNIGASSALFHRDQVNYIQKKINVPCKTLKSFMDENKIFEIDLLCLDLQGYEKIALDGLFENIKFVKNIISEVSFHSFYHSDILFEEYKQYLENNGFKHVETESYGGFGDSLFVNTRI